MIQLSLIGCFRNCVNQVEPLLRQWIPFLDEKIISYELLLMNDGSRDGTGRALDNARRKWGVTRNVRVFHQLIQDEEATFKSAFLQARGKFIGIWPREFRLLPEDMGSLWDAREGKVLILAQRRHRLDPGSSQWASQAIARIGHKLSGVSVSDPDCPFRLYETSVLQWALSQAGNARGLEPLLAFLIKEKFSDQVVEVPVPYRIINDVKKPKGSLLKECGRILQFRKQAKQLLRLVRST